jgi:hypothetical protein
MDRAAKFEPSSLPAMTREYLSRARRHAPERRGPLIPNFSTPQDLGWLAIGLAAVAYALFLIFDENLMDAPQVDWWPVTLFVIGCCFVCDSLNRILIRLFGKSYIGDFQYLDDSYWWEVSATEVKVTLLKGLTNLTGNHAMSNGSYQASHFKLQFPGGLIKKTVNNKEGAEQIARHLYALVAGYVFSRSGEFPTGKRMGTWNTGATLIAGTAVFAFASAFFVAPEMALYFKEETMYQRALTAKTEDRDAKYLDAFPNGRHRAAIIVLRDERMFAAGKDTLVKNKSAQDLRRYLTIPANILHRDEATALINEHYDRAIARMQAIAEKTSSINGPLFNAFISLLNSMKTAPTPVVKVGFDATNEVAPAARSATAERERMVYVARMQINPELKRIESASPAHTAIIDLGGVFTREQIERRERIILDRLKSAVQSVLDADIIQLEPCAKGKAGTDKPRCQIYISYRTYPSGTLYLYTKSTTINGRPVTSAGPDETAGLLRGYAMKWSLAIAPDDASKPYTLQLDSSPMSQLRMNGSPDDPAWAPYAVMLYSAFHDFSNRLIGSFGMEAPRSPNRFRFDDAVGNVS